MFRLRKQAQYCDFGTSLNDNLRDQLIQVNGFCAQEKATEAEEYHTGRGVG